MCLPAGIAALGALGGTGAATAAGATATAATTGGLLQTIGTLASIGGTLYGASSAAKAGQAQADALNQQAANERALAATEAERTGRRFQMQMAQQRAEMASRGIDLSSPTAVVLGQNAAREMSFAQQEARSRGVARSSELTAAGQAASARGRQAFLRGGLSAAGNLLSAAPDLWPGLYNNAVNP